MNIVKTNNENVTLQLVDVTDSSKQYTIENSDYVPNGTYNLTLQAKEGYLITKAGYTNSMGIWTSFTISDDKKTATKTNFKIQSNISLTVTTTELTTYLVEIDNSNATLQLVDTADNSKQYNIEDSASVPNGTYNMSVYAKDGYLIQSAGFVNSDGVWTTLDISDDKKTATVLNYELDKNITISVKTIVEQPNPPEGGDGVSGFNHLYLVDKSILTKLSKERFTLSSNDELLDLGIYIVNILELPFSIGDDIKGLETQITLGNVLVETKAVELLDDELILNIGKITVPSKYNNSYDYLNTNVYLHLPFVKTIELDVDYVIDQTITIQYLIDLFTGDASIVIRSTKLDNEIVYNENVRIGKDIPFVTNTGKIQGDLQKLTSLNNQLFTAFIEVIRNKPYDVNNRFNDETTIQTQLINESGFVTVNKIILNSNATLQEKNKIEDILRNGVYIKSK